MSDEEEHQPSDRATATAHYEELKVFGSPKAAVVDVREGDRFPSAPRSFTWQRIRREEFSGAESSAMPVRRIIPGNIEQ